MQATQFELPDGNGETINHASWLHVAQAAQATAEVDTVDDTVIHHPLDCSKHRNALICHKFSHARDVEKVWVDPRSPCVPKATYDAQEKAAKLTVGTLCGANTAGDLRFDYRLQTSPIWLQFRFKQEQAFIDEPRSFNLPSPKVFVMWGGPTSCSNNEFAQVNQYWRGYPQFYEACGAIQPLIKLPPYDYDLQPGGETRCHYQAPAERPGETCVSYRGDWATHTFRLDLDGSIHDGIPWVDGWIQYDGERRYHILSFELKITRQLQSVYFGPYMTGKSALVDHPEWSVWYQDILITRESILSR